MKTINISGKLRTTPQYSRKFRGLTFKFEYQPKQIYRALALARPPILTVIEFYVVVPEHLVRKAETLKSGDACLLVYPEKPGAAKLPYPVDLKLIEKKDSQTHPPHGDLE